MKAIITGFLLFIYYCSFGQNDTNQYSDVLVNSDTIFSEDSSVLFDAKVKHNALIENQPTQVKKVSNLPVKNENTNYSLFRNVLTSPWFILIWPLVLYLFGSFIWKIINRKYMTIEEKFENFRQYVTNELDTQKTMFEEQIKNLENKIHELKRETILLPNNRSSENNFVSTTVDTTSQPYESQSSNVLLNLTKLYAKSESNGVFKSLANEFTSNNLYFELNVDVEKKIGSYSITDNFETFTLIVSDGRDNVISAVEEYNHKEFFKSRIETIESGMLKKVEEGWMITQKAKIKYS